MQMMQCLMDTLPLLPTQHAGVKCGVYKKMYCSYLIVLHLLRTMTGDGLGAGLCATAGAILGGEVIVPCAILGATAGSVLGVTAASPESQEQKRFINLIGTFLKSIEEDMKVLNQAMTRVQSKLTFSLIFATFTC